MHFQPALACCGIAPDLDRRLPDGKFASPGHTVFCGRLAWVCGFCSRVGIVVLGGESIHAPVRLRNLVHDGAPARGLAAGGFRHPRSLVAQVGPRCVGILSAAAGDIRIAGVLTR